MLLFAPLYAETIHHAIHADSNQAEHHDDGNCAVCHFSGGNVAPQTDVIVLILPDATTENILALTVASPKLVEQYSSAQPRSPPSHA